MKDNSQYNNLPGAELEQLSKNMAVPPSPEPPNVVENTESSNSQSVLSDDISTAQPKPADNATAACPRNSYPHPQDNDPNISSPLTNTFRNKLKNNSQSYSDPNYNPPRVNTLRNKIKADSPQSGSQNQKPQNTDPRFNYSGTDTQGNKFKSSPPPGDYSTASPRNSYPHPQNTDPNINYPRTNTLRNKYKNDSPTGNYPNSKPQNTDPNFNPPRSNTLRNKFRNDSPQGGGFPYGRPQNGYPYPQNNDMRYNMPGNNSFDYRNGYRPNNFYNSSTYGGYPYPPYRPNGFPGNQYSAANMNYAYYHPNYYPGGYNPNQPYPPYSPPAPSPNNVYPQNQINPAYSPVRQPFFNELNQKELQRLELAKDCSRAGTATIALFIVMFIVAIIIEVIAVFCGVSHDLPDMANDPYMGFTPMGFYMYTGLASLLSIFLPALILMRGSGRKISELVPFKPIEGKKLAAIVMCGMSLCMVAQLMAALIQINFSLFGIDIYKGLETATATGFYDFLMLVICTAVIPALVEEFAYRGLVVGILKRHDEMLAVFGSAFLFGMLHGNFGQIPFAFTVGLILGYARVKTDSMLPGILIHFGNNLYAVILTELDEILPDPFSTIIDIVTILVLVAIGLVCSNYLLKNHKDFFKLKKEKSLLTYKEKLSTFLKTGTVIVSIAILTIASFFILFAV